MESEARRSRLGSERASLESYSTTRQNTTTTIFDQTALTLQVLLWGGRVTGRAARRGRRRRSSPPKKPLLLKEKLLSLITSLAFTVHGCLDAAVSIARPTRSCSLRFAQGNPDPVYLAFRSAFPAMYLTGVSSTAAPTTQSLHGVPSVPEHLSSERTWKSPGFSRDVFYGAATVETRTLGFEP